MFTDAAHSGAGVNPSLSCGTLPPPKFATSVNVCVRPPSFVNLQALKQMCVGHLVADVVAIIGTLDIVLGEIDR